MTNFSHFHMVSILCDSASMKHIRIKCRCGKELNDEVPEEIKNSNLILQFECTCGRYHLVQNNRHQSMSKEEYHDRFPIKKAPDYVNNGDIQYDA